MRRGLLLLIVCQVSSVQADDALTACLEIARRQTPISVELSQDCPVLFAQLQKQQLISASEPVLQEASPAQLEFLALSSENLRQGLAISVNDLTPLLEGVIEESPPDTETQWWQAFQKWLDKLKGGDYEAQYQWLRRFLEAMRPSEQTVLGFVYASIALLVIASAWLVFSELYIAGFFSKLRKQRQSLLKPKLTEINSPAFAPHHSDDLPAHRQMAVLLGQVVAKLIQQKLIPDDATLTYRQVLSCLKQQGVNQEVVFARLVQIAEPVLYGGGAVDAQILSDYRQDAKILLDAQPL